MPAVFCNNVGFIHGSQEVVYLSITDNAKEKETCPDEPLGSNTNLTFTFYNVWIKIIYWINTVDSQ